MAPGATGATGWGAGCRVSEQAVVQPSPKSGRSAGSSREASCFPGDRPFIGKANLAHGVRGAPVCSERRASGRRNLAQDRRFLSCRCHRGRWSRSCGCGWSRFSLGCRGWGWGCSRRLAERTEAARRTGWWRHSNPPRCCISPASPNSCCWGWCSSIGGRHPTPVG